MASPEQQDGELTQALFPRQAQILSLFSAWDANGDGAIDSRELTEVLRHMGFDELHIPLLFEAADTSKDGKIDYGEFLRWMYSDAVPSELGDLIPKEQPQESWDVAAIGALARDDGRALRLAFMQEGAELRTIVRIGDGPYYRAYYSEQLIFECRSDGDAWSGYDHIYATVPTPMASFNRYSTSDDIVDLIVKNQKWDCRQAMMLSGLLPYTRRGLLKFASAAVSALIADDGEALLLACTLPDADLSMAVFLGFRVEKYDGAGDEDYHWVNFGETCIYSFDTCNRGGFARDWSARDYIAPDAPIERPSENKYEAGDDLVSLIVKNERHRCGQALLSSSVLPDTQRARLLLWQAPAETPVREARMCEGFGWDGEWDVTWVSGDYDGQKSTVTVIDGRLGVEESHADAHADGAPADQSLIEQEEPVSFLWKDGTEQTVQGLTRNKVLWSTTRRDQPCILWERVTPMP